VGDSGAHRGGAGLRLLLLSYLPYAFWGADSRSYYSFAHKLISEFYVSLDEKRRYLYPILMLPVSLLPGAPLRWLAILQHALGVVTLLATGLRRPENARALAAVDRAGDGALFQPFP